MVGNIINSQAFHHSSEGKDVEGVVDVCIDLRGSIRQECHLYHEKRFS